MLAHCSPSSKWVPGGNTGEIKATRKGTGHHTPNADGAGKVSSLKGISIRTKVYGTNFYCIFFTVYPLKYLFFCFTKAQQIQQISVVMIKSARCAPVQVDHIPPPNYLDLSIFACLCCCCPLGLFAMVESNQVCLS